MFSGFLLQMFSLAFVFNYECEGCHYVLIQSLSLLTLSHLLHGCLPKQMHMKMYLRWNYFRKWLRIVMGIVHPKFKICQKCTPFKFPFVSSSEQIRRNVALHHLLTNRSSAVNGCHQNESSNSWQKHHNCHESGCHSLQLHITHGLHLPSCTAHTHSRPPLHQSHSCHHSLISLDCLTSPAPHSLTHI